MEYEEHRIVDLIVRFERRIDASRFTVDREGRLIGRQRIASGYVEVDAPGEAPRIILDRPSAQMTAQLEHWIRVRWSGLQADLRAGAPGHA